MWNITPLNGTRVNQALYKLSPVTQKLLDTTEEKGSARMICQKQAARKKKKSNLKDYTDKEMPNTLQGTCLYDFSK